MHFKAAEIQTIKIFINNDLTTLTLKSTEKWHFQNFVKVYSVVYEKC